MPNHRAEFNFVPPQDSMCSATHKNADAEGCIVTQRDVCGMWPIEKYRLYNGTFRMMPIMSESVHMFVEKWKRLKVVITEWWEYIYI